MFGELALPYKMCASRGALPGPWNVLGDTSRNTTATPALEPCQRLHTVGSTPDMGPGASPQTAAALLSGEDGLSSPVRQLDVPTPLLPTRSRYALLHDLARVGRTL